MPDSIGSAGARISSRAMRHAVALLLALITPALAGAATTIRVMPPDGGVLAAGQFVDIRVEATGTDGAAPSGLRVWVDGVEWTSRNDLTAQEGAAAGTTNFLARRFSRSTAGALVIRATTADGAAAESRLQVEAWAGPVRPRRPRARNIILFLGDGMGASHRTAARHRVARHAQRQGRGPAGDGHAGGDRPGDDRVAQCRRSPTRRPGWPRT